MSEMHDIQALVMMLLPVLPLQLVWLVGMILALMRWSRHPGVSALVLIALMLFSFSTLAGALFSYWLPRMLMESGRTSSQLNFYFSILSITRAAVGTVGWILLLVALFGWRYSPTQMVMEYYPDDRGRDDTDLGIQKPRR